MMGKAPGICSTPRGRAMPPRRKEPMTANVRRERLTESKARGSIGAPPRRPDPPAFRHRLAGNILRPAMGRFRAVAGRFEKQDTANGMTTGSLPSNSRRPKHNPVFMSRGATIC